MAAPATVNQTRRPIKSTLQKKNYLNLDETMNWQIHSSIQFNQFLNTNKNKVHDKIHT